MTATRPTYRVRRRGALLIILASLTAALPLAALDPSPAHADDGGGGGGGSGSGGSGSGSGGSGGDDGGDDG
ncbi:hypothetical protein, partial [Aestuariivirga sp.]|uniref:hypothetical protein n=1 Tax=Aestuariivirga sp. TaxID=2650926 RepID=UPI0035AE1B82